MRNIDMIRADIDELDREISAALCRRLALADEMKAAKEAAGALVYDAKREASVLTHVCGAASNERDAASIGAIYEAVIRVCRERQL